MRTPLHQLILPALLVVIHTLDMELTRHYIGNNYMNETFLPMSYCIKLIGIYNAVWVSRVCIYSLLFLYIKQRNRPLIGQLMLLGTLLYWMAMVPWLTTLNIIQWPGR